MKVSVSPISDQALKASYQPVRLLSGGHLPSGRTGSEGGLLLRQSVRCWDRRSAVARPTAVLCQRGAAVRGPVGRATGGGVDGRAELASGSGH
jgi:hypothetical protein